MLGSAIVKPISFIADALGIGSFIRDHLRGSDSDAIWKRALGALSGEERAAASGLRGMRIDETEWEKRMVPRLVAGGYSAEAAAHRSQDIADKLRRALEHETAARFEGDPGAFLAPVTTAVLDIKSTLRQQGEDVSKATEALGACLELWAEVRARLQPPAGRYWQTLPHLLAADEEPELARLRLRGPGWWHYQEGWVHQCPEVDALLQAMAEHAAGGVYALTGPSAAGKTVVAGYVGYEWERGGVPVFYLRPRDIAEREREPAALASSMDALASDVGGPDGERPLFIIDDLHSDTDFACGLINSLTRVRPPAAHVLLVARETGGRLEEALGSLGAGRIQVAGDRYDEAARAIVQLRRKREGRDPLSDEDLSQIVATARPDLWLLMWLAEKYEGGAVDRALAYDEARSHLRRLQSALATHPHAAEVILAVAALSRFEAATNARFLGQQLPSVADVEGVLQALAGLGELEALRGPEGDQRYEYVVPHAALAQVYMEAADRAPREWGPGEWLRGELGDGDWASQLAARALRQGCDDLTMGLVREFWMPGERGARLSLHREAMDALSQACMRLLGSGRSSERGDAASFLARYPDARAVSGLLDLLRRPDGEEEGRKQAAYALVGVGGAAVGGLVQALGDHEWGVRSWAAFALGEIRDPRGVEPLLALLGDPQAHVRWHAIRALGRIGDPQVVPHLIAVLSDRASEGRETAADALGDIGDRGACDGLVSVMADDTEDENVRVYAASALHRIGDASVLPALITQLRSPLGRLARQAAYAIAELGNGRALDDLLWLLRHGDEGGREAAAAALGKVAANCAVEPLAGALEDESQSAARQAARALGDIGDVAAVPALLEALHDDREGVREEVARALGRLGREEAVEPLIAALKRPDAQRPTYVIEALGRLGDVRAVGPLLSWLGHPFWYMRMAAAWALGDIGDARAIEPLIGLWRDVDNRYREACIEEGVATTFGWAAGVALVKQGSQAVQALAGCLKDGDWYVRLMAVVTLEGIGGEEALRHVRRMESDPEAVVRDAAKRAASADCPHGFVLIPIPRARR